MHCRYDGRQYCLSPLTPARYQHLRALARVISLAQMPISSPRLTKQVSAFYDDVMRLLSAAPLSQHFDKSWTSHVQVKATLYDVESQLQQAAQLHKDDDIAPEIARLKVPTCSNVTA